MGARSGVRDVGRLFWRRGPKLARVSVPVAMSQTRMLSSRPVVIWISESSGTMRVSDGLGFELDFDHLLSIQHLSNQWIEQLADFSEMRLTIINAYH